MDNMHKAITDKNWRVDESGCFPFSYLYFCPLILESAVPWGFSVHQGRTPPEPEAMPGVDLNRSRPNLCNKSTLWVMAVVVGLSDVVGLGCWFQMAPKESAKFGKHHSISQLVMLDGTWLHHSAVRRHAHKHIENYIAHIKERERERDRDRDRDRRRGRGRGGEGEGAGRDASGRLCRKEPGQCLFWMVICPLCGGVKSSGIQIQAPWPVQPRVNRRDFRALGLKKNTNRRNWSQNQAACSKNGN